MEPLKTPLRFIRYNASGWSLVELMIGVAICGTLAAIAVPNFLAFRDKARVAATVGTGESIRSSLAAFAVDSTNNHYPLAASIASYPELTAYINANGASLPDSPTFQLMFYTTSDQDGDRLADDYSMRLSVLNVSTPINGGQVLITPRGIFRCTANTTESCDK